MRDAVLFAAAALGACATVPAGASVLGAWELVAVEGEAPVSAASRPITMELQPSVIRGKAPCNGYGGGYRIIDGRLDLTDVSITVAGCIRRDRAPTNIDDSDFIDTLNGGRLRLVGASRLRVTGDGRTFTFQRTNGPAS